MKPILRIILLTLAASACALPVIRAEDSAPTDCPPTPRHEKFRHHGGERMAKALGLTADQQAKMKTVAEEQKKAVDAVLADTALTPDQKREKMAQLRQDGKTKRHALLTPEQQKKAEKMKTKFKERRRAHATGGGPDRN